MKTRSGLSIKKVATGKSYYEPYPSARCNTYGSQLNIQNTKGNISVKYDSKNTGGMSIVTRYEMLLDGVEVDSFDLNVGNTPSMFLATEAEIVGSVLSAGHLTYESYKLVELPTVPVYAKSLSMPNLSIVSNASPQNYLPLLERSLSCGSPTSSPVSSQWVTNEIRQVLQDHPLFDVDKESDEELFKKLSQFMMPVSGPSIFKCKACRRIYGGIKEFGQHVNTHLRHKNKCHICGCLFSRTFLLKGHLRTHTGEKPFECNACGKKFADRSNWRTHINTHSMTRKIHSCPTCGKTFAQKRYLRKHIVEVCKQTNDADNPNSL